MSKLSKLPLVATMLASGCAYTTSTTNKPADNQPVSNQVSIDDIKKRMMQRLGATEEGVQPVNDSDTKYKVIKCLNSRVLSQQDLRASVLDKARGELGKHINNDKGLSEAYIVDSSAERFVYERVNIGNQRMHIDCVLLTAPRRTQRR